MSFFKNMASPFKGKAAKEEEKLNIAVFKQQEEERLSAARAGLQTGRLESQSLSSLSSQRPQGTLLPSQSGNMYYQQVMPPRRYSDGNMSHRSIPQGPLPAPSPKPTTWKKLKETFRFRPPSPKNKADAAAAELQAASSQIGAGSRTPSVLSPVAPLSSNLHRQSPSQQSVHAPSPQGSTQLQLPPPPWQQQQQQVPQQQQLSALQQLVQKPPRATSPRQPISGPMQSVLKPEGVMTLQQKQMGTPTTATTSSFQSSPQGPPTSQIQVRDLQHKLNVMESELQEVGQLKRSLAQEQTTANDWKERWNTQNFKLNLMVDMLALNLAEKEYPTDKPSAVSVLGQPAGQGIAKFGVTA